MRKIKFLVVVSLMMLFVAGSYCGVSADEVSGDFRYYEYDDGTIEITRYIGTEENVVVPAEIDGKKVVRIGDYAFWNNEVIKSVSLPEGLLEIGNLAFGDNYFTYQIKVYIPNSVIEIDDEAFSGRHIMYPSYEPVVRYQPLIVGDPNSYAKTYADSHNVSFSCIEHSDITVYHEEIAPTYSSYGRKAGYFCSVCDTAVSGGEFIPRLKHGSAITNEPPTTHEPPTTAKPIVPVTISRNYQKGSKILSSSSTYKVTNTSTKNSTVEFSNTTNSKKSLIIPAIIKVGNKAYKVTSVAKNAFKNNKKLKKATLGKNIKKINANAFKGCKNLKIIIIKSKSLKFIGKDAFKGIYPKARIKVPASRLKKYKKLFKEKRLKSTVKIVKI